MDWKTLRREKLEKTEAYEPNHRLDSRWGRGLEAISHWWERFHTYALWEKLIIATTAVLLVVLTPIALVSLLGGDDGQTQAGALLPTPTLFILADQPTSTPTITPTATEVKPTPTATTTPQATQLPDRDDCDEIASTSYRSASEREWYLENCANSEPPTPPPPPPPPPGPAATATPATYLSASQAAALAAQWIVSTPSLGGLTLTNGGCAAGITSPGQWQASCQGETIGCAGSACVITLRVCFADRPQPNFGLC